LVLPINPKIIIYIYQKQIHVFDILLTLSKEIVMSNVSKIETVVFVYFSIKPIPIAFKESLYDHLMSNVWRARGGEVEEAICLNGSFGASKDFITDVRYQFGENFDQYEVEDLAELIDEQISVWSSMANV
jgi:hypothetical protein